MEGEFEVPGMPIPSTRLTPKISSFLKLKLMNKPVAEIRKKKIKKPLADYENKCTFLRHALDYCEFAKKCLSWHIFLDQGIYSY